MAYQDLIGYFTPWFLLSVNHSCPLTFLTMTLDWTTLNQRQNTERIDFAKKLYILPAQSHSESILVHFFSLKIFRTYFCHLKQYFHHCCCSVKESHLFAQRCLTRWCESFLAYIALELMLFWPDQKLVATMTLLLMDDQSGGDCCFLDWSIGSLQLLVKIVLNLDLLFWIAQRPLKHKEK